MGAQFFTWFFTWCGLNCDQATGEAHKKPILVSRICFNLFLKLIIFSTSTTCCSRLFHRSTTLREKKCFITSLLLLTLYSFALCPRVPLHPWSKIKNSPISRLVYHLIILNTSIKSDIFLLNSTTAAFSASLYKVNGPNHLSKSSLHSPQKFDRWTVNHHHHHKHFYVVKRLNKLIY